MIANAYLSKFSNAVLTEDRSVVNVEQVLTFSLVCSATNTVLSSLRQAHLSEERRWSSAHKFGVRNLSGSPEAVSCRGSS